MPIVYIGGTPGVGKTIVAKELARRLRAGYVNVAELALCEGLVLGYDKERGAYAVDEERLRERLRELASSATVVVDTHVPSATPPELVEAAVILRLDPRVLRQRLEARGYPSGKVAENVQAEILDACLVESVELFGESKCFEVDATSKSLQQVVDEVLEVIGTRRGRRLGSVNWLETLGEEVLDYLKG